ncbi:MAG: YjjG family noncanonical pyrimidine nucleotidase [Lentimicrobium sp.]|jgi:putative hydrolase of the HAD superfamily|nr:YjjG family noncanonical pyrimidine nucleotidase [Lentimicrobium sp.]
MKKLKLNYTDIFFDLDGTLWDFETNSLETLNEIYENHQLQQAGIPDFEKFLKIYHVHNDRLWDLYRAGEVEKDALKINRFVYTLNHFGIDNKMLADTIAFDYVSISPTKTHLFAHAHQTLNYLKFRYRLHIITNGFNEVQFVKLRKSGLSDYFTHVITSELAGVSKPDSGIFNYALTLAGARAQNSLMIGDDLDIDIHGAASVGMDQLYFSRAKLLTNNINRIQSLDELQRLL